MINDFINHLKGVDLQKFYNEEYECVSDEFFFNDFCFQIELNTAKNRADVKVWKNENEEWVEVKIEGSDMNKLICFLTSLEFKKTKQEAPITDYYNYYGVQQSNFI